MTGFPASIDAIDRDWFGQCLARNFPGTQVTRLDRGTIISGTATKVEYFLGYNDAGQAHALPASLWLKCGLETQLAEQAAHSTIEAFFFRDLAPSLTLNIPKPYGTEIAPDQASGIVIYEDLNLRPVTFGNQDTPVPPDRMDAILAMLARLHAAHWRSPSLNQWEWLKPGGVIHSNNVTGQFMGFWDYATGRPRFDAIPDALRDKGRIGAAIHQLVRDDAANPICVVHGDPHVGNQFYDTNGAPGLLDWATIMQGHWAWDVSYAIISSQTVEQRRACQHEQLARYLKQLEGLGVQAPDFEAAWRDYVRHAAWMFLFALCPAELQPEPMCIRNAERAAAAIIDLGTLDALLT
jgi:hypothetical protein